MLGRSRYISHISLSCGLFSGLYVFVWCDDAPTMMTFIGIPYAPANPRKEFSSPCFLLSLIPNDLTLSRHSDGDTTLSGGLRNSQSLHLRLVSSICFRSGSIFCVEWMKLVNWQSGCRPLSCHERCFSASRERIDWRASSIRLFECAGPVALDRDRVRVRDMLLC